jgi:predicted nucleic acid-binding protein
MRLFLDANVLFSAAKSAGPMREMLISLVRRGHELHADEYVVEEPRRNLALKVPEAVGQLHDVLRVITVAAGPAKVRAHASLPLPDKDQPVMEAAIALACDILVTGDKSHFGALYGKSIEGVEVLSPAQVAGKLL